MLILIYCVFTAHLTWVSGLAVPRELYHELSSVLFNQTSQFKVPDPYFAYSITYLPSSKRLIVGAPNADNIGEIYSCSLQDTRCTKLLRNTYYTKRYSDVKYNNSYWYGAAVKAGPGYFVTCAPLYTTESMIQTGRVGTFSRCFKYTDIDKEPVLIKTIDQYDRWADAMHEHQMDSFGWSIDVVNEESMFGGPAMYTGRAMRYYNKKAESLFPDDKIQYNFGYSVAIGKFFLKANETDKCREGYAVGSTYGSTGIGKVYIYYEKHNKYQLVHDLNQYLLDKPSWVGSMYGATLCAARILRDIDAQALLVGAPTFANSHTVNLGAVYVLKPEKFPQYPKHHRTILGKRDGSYFGSSIVSIGDLNGDTLDEIAIGAPYEDNGKGAVYIYSGDDLASDRGDITYMQRIVPAEGVRSFGHSLTALQDYDDNGCNELAIGAPESNSVMLLRCIATVTVKLFTEIPPNLHIKNKVAPEYRNKTHFQFKSCIEVVYPKKPTTISAEILVNVKITHHDAKIASPESHIFKIDGKSPICRNIAVETPEHGNYEAPIFYEFKAHQINPPMNEKLFNPARVAISDWSDLDLDGHISIADCAIADNCTVDIQYINTVFENITTNEYEYVIGSSDKLNMELYFVNKLETAYDPCVLLNITSATVLAHPSACEEFTSNNLKCAPEITLRRNEKWNTNLIALNTAGLTNKNKDITVTITLYDQCEKSKPKINNVVLRLLTDNTGIKINAITDSGKDDKVNSTQSELRQGKWFQQKYTVSNSGPTTWEDVNVILTVQKKYFIMENFTATLLIEDKSELSETNCEYLKETDDDIIHTCFINKLAKNVKADIIIPLFIIPYTLSDSIAKKENHLYTELSLHLDYDIVLKQSLTNTFLIVELKWDFWIIIASLILGLILLVLLIVILSKRGFLRRKNKEQLEQVQRSVKRQTMQRRSMAPAPRTQDQENLLEDLQNIPTPKPRTRIRVKSDDGN